MIVRAYNPKVDAEQLKSLNPAGIDIEKDFVIVVESNGRIVGALAWRAIGYAHDFIIESGNALARRICEKAIDYALGMGKTLRVGELIFSTDRGNKSFQEFMKTLNAYLQDDGEIFYRMEVR